MGKPLHCHVSMKLYKDEKVFGPGAARLLQLVEQTGSLNQAAKEMGMSYNKAWNIVHLIEQNSGVTFLMRQSGGVHGGGAVLTEAAKRLVADYKQFSNEVNRYAEERFSAYFADLREDTDEGD